MIKCHWIYQTNSKTNTKDFIFENWLMDAINRNEGYAAKRINDLAEKEMPYFTKLFGFKAF